MKMTHHNKQDPSTSPITRILEKSETISAPDRINLSAAVPKERTRVSVKGVIVARVPTDIAVAYRARWLAELSGALDEAQSLVWQLALAGVRNADVLDLSARVEAALAEARSLRLSRLDKSSNETCPDWSDSVLWDPRAGQRA
jgi:hypothetical protein